MTLVGPPPTALVVPAGRGLGATPVRPDVPPKLDGTFAFANDLTAPGMAFGATVRSPWPHARLRDLDASRALRAPGVLAVLTLADVPGARRVGHIVADQPVFVDGVARYHGEPVAFVVATTQEAAWRAADLVELDWEPLPVLDDPEQALTPGAPVLHPGRGGEHGNLVRRLVLRQGEPDTSAPVVVRGTWWTGRQDQAFLAPESALAVPDPDGGVTLHLATQDLHTDQAQIAAALGVPPAAVRLVLAGVGGAFGGREDITLQVHLCLAALRLGRPVKTTYRRGESTLAHPKRHPARLAYEVGADHDGRLRFVRARILLDGGAYASTSGPVLGSCCYFAAGPYRVPSVDVVGESVYTNNPVSGAMRGFGAVQACFGIESTMDRLAARLGLDPVELRRRNVLGPGDVLATSGQRVGPATPVRELLDRCAALPLPDPDGTDPHPYARPGGTGGTTRGEGVRRGVGVALGLKNVLYGEGAAEWSTATVRLGAGGAEVVSAATENGQGIEGALVQVAAEVLGGMPVRVATASTAAGYAGSSSASRQTWMASGAVAAAARAAAAHPVDRAAAVLGPPAGAALVPGTTGDGRAAVVVDGVAHALADVLGEEVVEAAAEYRPPATERGDPSTGAGDVHVAWMFVAHRAVVDVDVELGTVRVVQVATAQDVGRAVNPREVRGQVLGGIAQGIGLALTEEVRSSGGVVAHPGFTDYLVPTAADMPDVVVDLMEVAEPRSPFGLKGVGEPPVLSSTAAVVAAVRDACGRELPRAPVRAEDIIGHTG